MNHHKVLLILSLMCLIFIQCTSSDVKHNNRKIVKTALVDDDSSNLTNGENLGHRSRRSSKLRKKLAKATTVTNSKKNSKTPDILLINVQKDRLQRVIGRLGGKGNVKYREDPCTSEPCFNNGVCEIDVARGFNNFICKCPPGFSGFTCQKEEAYPQNVMSLHEYRIGRPRLTERHLQFSTRSTVLFIVAVFVSFLLLTHACRTWSKKSDLKYAYREAIKDGRDVPEPPDTLTISNQLCQDVFCCCCRPKDKKLSVIKKRYIGHRYPVSQKELDDIAAGRKQLGRKDSLGIIRSRLNDLSPEARDLLSDQLIRRTSSMRAVSSKNPVFQGYVDTLKHVMSRSEQKISGETGPLTERTLSASPPAQFSNRKLSFKTLSEPRVDLEYSSPSKQDLADNEESSSDDETETEQQLSPEHTALLQNDDLEDYLVDLVVKLSELEASVTTERPYELPEDVENEEMLLVEHNDVGFNLDNAVEVEHNEDVGFNLDDNKEDETEKYESTNSTRIQMTPLKSMPRSGLSFDSSSTEKGRTGSNQKVNEIISKISNDETLLQSESPISETGGRFMANPSFREYDLELEGEKGFQDLKSINNSNMRRGMSTRVSNSSSIHSHQPPQYLQSGPDTTLGQGKTSKEGEATRLLSDPSTVTSYIHHIQGGLSKINPYCSRTDILLTESRGRISPVSETSKYNREKITPLAKQPEGTRGIEERNQDILDWMQSRVTLTPGSSQTTFGDISSPQQFQNHSGSGPILRHVKISEEGEATRPSSDPTTVTSYIHHINKGLSRTHPHYSRTDILLSENRDRANPKSETSMHSRERVTPVANNKLESMHGNGQWSQDNLDWVQSRVTLTPGSSRTTINDMLSPQQFQQHFKELVHPKEATIKLKIDTEPYAYPEDLEDIADKQVGEGVRFFKKTFPVISGFLATQIRSRRQPGEDDEDEENSSTNLDINNSRNIESNSQYRVTTITDDCMKDINDRIPLNGKIQASPLSSNQEYISRSHVVDDSDYKQIEGMELIVDPECMLKVDKLTDEIESSKMEVELPPLLDYSFGMSTEVQTSDQLCTNVDASHTSAPIDDIVEDMESPAVVQTCDQIETILNASQTSAQIDDILEDIESLSEVINDITVLPNDSSVSRRPRDVNNSSLKDDYDDDDSSMY